MQNFLHSKAQNVYINHSEVDKASVQQGKHLFNSAVVDWKVSTATDFECIKHEIPVLVL